MQFFSNFPTFFFHRFFPCTNTKQLLLQKTCSLHNVKKKCGKKKSWKCGKSTSTLSQPVLRFLRYRLPIKYGWQSVLFSNSCLQVFFATNLSLNEVFDRLFVSFINYLLHFHQLYANVGLSNFILKPKTPWTFIYMYFRVELYTCIQCWRRQARG